MVIETLTAVGGLFTFIGLPLLFLLLLASWKIVNEYERGVKFRLGKYVGMMQPGLRIVIPIIETWERVDVRTIVADVPSQDAITKDNVTVKVNAVLFYRVLNAEESVLEVENYDYAVSQLAQTTMRDVVGTVDLDTLLSQREKISDHIRMIVDKETDLWGIKVEDVELKHIELPGNMIRTMAKQAEAERERRAVIINAEGERVAAENLAQAAEILGNAEGAMHLRTLHTLNDMSSDQTNSVYFVVPLETTDAYQRKKKQKA